MMWGMDGMMGGWVGSWMISGALLSFAFGFGLLALMIIGIIAGVRWLATAGNPSGARGESDRALQIIRERYAKGEISREKFERMRRDLL
ncbi:MAG TPA: SHOCT domain-containing protein [Methylomirabilota bacterium]|nr:SHOCT domain-containing protein [Methylomirabilota bacterium]